jgi:hypothetical protein
MKQELNFNFARKNGLSRRQFMSRCGACLALACASTLPVGVKRLFAQPSPPAADTEKAKVRLIFCHEPPERATWPYQGYDYEGRKKELTARLCSSCPNIDFMPLTLQKAEDAQKLLQTDTEVDGYLVYLVGIWTGVPRTIMTSGRPTILVDDLYAGSGEFLIDYAAAKREGLKVVGVSSSRFEDVVEAVKCFECMKKLRSSVILDVSDAEKLWGDPQVIKEVFGTEVKQVYSPEINAAYKQAGRAQAVEWAARWIQEAEKVVEPSREEIEKSAAMYLAEKSLLEKYKAQAITMDCLGLFYGGKLPAYPCLGFFQLNNDGRVGACEADLPSTTTMLLMTYLVGRPGYISDPVIDTSKNEIIYAHCVASNKVFGPKGAANPYHIRSHSEDRKGAVVRSLLPLGEITTTLEFNTSRKEFVMHQSTSIANIDEDKACRTKLAAEVKGDIEKLLGEWDRFGWHRVTFFGDHKKAVEMISALLGIKIVTEA